MTTCIKCGKEIPDGERSCAECGLNPGAAPPRPRPSARQAAVGGLARPCGRLKPPPLLRPRPPLSVGGGGCGFHVSAAAGLRPLRRALGGVLVLSP